MLLFFIYAALGVELFGRLGEWPLWASPQKGMSDPRNMAPVSALAHLHTGCWRMQGTGLDQVNYKPLSVSSDCLFTVT